MEIPGDTKFRDQIEYLGSSEFLCYRVRMEETKEEAMPKVLLLALVAMFLTAAGCRKSEETAPAPEASASAASEASPAAAAPEASPAASPAAP